MGRAGIWGPCRDGERGTLVLMFKDKWDLDSGLGTGFGGRMDKLSSTHFPLHSRFYGEAEPPRNPGRGWEQSPGPEGQRVGTLGGDWGALPAPDGGGRQEHGLQGPASYSLGARPEGQAWGGLHLWGLRKGFAGASCLEPLPQSPGYPRWLSARPRSCSHSPPVAFAE